MFILRDDGFIMTFTLAQTLRKGRQRQEGQIGVGVRAGIKRREAETDEERLSWVE